MGGSGAGGGAAEWSGAAACTSMRPMLTLTTVGSSRRGARASVAGPGVLAGHAG
jgi:hypothetical protein